MDDALREFEALLGGSLASEDADDEIVKALLTVRPQRIVRPRTGSRNPQLDLDSMDRADQTVGAPIGTMREAWLKARSKRSRS